MSPVLLGAIGFIVLFSLLALGLPVGVGMALVGFLGFLFLVSPAAAITKMAVVPFTTIVSWDLSALPLFILMAQIVFVSGMGGDLYTLASKWLGRLPGGVAMGTVAACAGFGAISASSIATAVTMGSVAIPEMKKLKYAPSLAAGCVAAGGTMGSLIPPSGILIIYGIITETSIGKLFIAGIIPGIIQALLYMILIYIMCTLRPNMGPKGPVYTFKEKILAFRNIGEIVALILLVLGGLLVGWFTPTEAGAVGAFGAIVFSLFRKRLSWEKFKQALMDTMKSTGMIYGILIGASIFNFFAAVTTIPAQVANFVGSLPLPPLAIMLVVMVVYLILGCFIDASAMLLLTIPVFFPLALSLGFNPVWFGIFCVIAIEVAMVTPPVGINVYVVAGIAPDIPMSTIFRGIFPFLIADAVRIAILMFVPATALFLPGLMR